MGWNRGRVLGLGQGRRWWLIHPPVTQFLAVSKVKHCEWLSGAATQPSRDQQQWMRQQCLNEHNNDRHFGAVASLGLA